MRFRLLTASEVVFRLSFALQGPVHIQSANHYPCKAIMFETPYLVCSGNILQIIGLVDPDIYLVLGDKGKELFGVCLELIASRNIVE